MSERIRGEYPASLIFAGFIAVALFFVGWGLGIQNEQRIQSNSAAREHSEYAEQYIQETCINFSGESLRECVHEAVASSAEHQRAERDLNAQRQMATWAFWLLWASAGTIIITALGVYYVRQTLIEASGATSAARDAVEVTREIGRDQSRAYVCAKECKLQVKSKDAFSLFLIVQNVGQTPARAFEIAFRVGLSGQWVEPTFEDTDFFGWNGLVGTSEPITLILDDSESAVFRQHSGWGENRIRVGGVIRYSTIFNEKRYSEFVFDCQTDLIENRMKSHSGSEMIKPISFGKPDYAVRLFDIWDDSKK